MNQPEDPNKGDKILDELVDKAAVLARPSADANIDAEIAFQKLSQPLKDSLQAHGLGTHFAVVKTGKEGHKQVFNALINVIKTGIVKGGVGYVGHGQLYSSAPFILISKPGQPLINPETGKVSGIALINGQYELLAPQLRKLFPHIPFVTCDELSESLLKNLK